MKDGIGDLPGKTVALSDAAVTRLQVGDLDAAFQRFIEARHLAEAAGAGQETAMIVKMGQRLACLRDANRLDAANEVVQGLLDITRRGKQRVVEHAAARVEAGNLCIDQGNLNQAVRHDQAGLKVLEKQDDQCERARLLGNLGEVERRRGDLDAAEQRIRAGLVLIPAEDAEGRVQAMQDLALVLDDSGRRQEAIALLEQTRDQAKRDANWEGYARAWIELGSIAWDEARPVLAMRRWQRALAVAETAGLSRYSEMAAINHPEVTRLERLGKYSFGRRNLAQLSFSR